ncbi:TetR/AcrR family transcriptional regulator [Agrococcus baldri]|uniref:HTH tetR-type domain-containing protein n=1 Tax=Agrococcus baldri TaxID=153730 RepID=A0AA87RIJ6_9MICO|nr:TetR/AcrR family transcriptional regulator [Agrococcus baldri]GEK80013.1 hypothetical protein ABA31_13640 [Agrococcus baldri]
MTEQQRQSSRDRILIAAATMIGEDPAARLSVRAVAARAGVSTGSLRFHFPTQRELQETVLAGIYSMVAPDDDIHDRSRPARDRLVDRLRQVLAPAGVGEQARSAWLKVHESFIAERPTEEARAAYLTLDRAGRRQIEAWLAVLTDEGTLAPGDNEQRALFLNTVITGLSIQRVLPAEDTVLTTETAVLYAAVDAVLGEPAQG